MITDAARCVIFTVILTAMETVRKHSVRRVAVPEDEVLETEFDGRPTHLLERIFYWGQNDFQESPQRRRSVSVGDVILIEKDAFLVVACGFKRLDKVSLKAYLRQPVVGRMLYTQRLGRS